MPPSPTVADVIAYTICYLKKANTQSEKASMLQIEQSACIHEIYEILVELMLTEAEKCETVYFNREAFIDVQIGNPFVRETDGHAPDETEPCAVAQAHESP